MNPAPRVLIVSRRFWPTSSDGTQRLLSLTSSLAAAGAQLSVLTARWHASWSSRIDFREMPVHRFEIAPTNPLRNARYSRGLAEWFTRNANQYDLVYCDAAELEAQILTSLQSGNQRLPVLVRFDPNELIEGSESRWQPGQKTIEACRRATNVVAPRSDAVQRLKSMGIADDKIIRIPDSTSPLTRSDATRAAARNALADINHDLYVRSTDQVVVCFCEFSRRSGVDLLVRAIGPLVQENRSLRVWLVGDSSERSRIYEQLRYNGWHNLIAMPGAFEDMDEVLRVADLVVVPGRGQGLGWIVPKCIASGISLLAVESPELRSMLPGDQEKLITYRDGDIELLRNRIEQWVQNPQALRNAIGVAREHIVGQRSNVNWETILTRTANAFSS
jgi:glycosyltransferase involved in cell wall biosynthesis